MKFKDLKLISPILDALKDQNYSEPTEIQAKSIPLVLNGTMYWAVLRLELERQQLLQFL